MKRFCTILLLIPHIALASYCGTNTFPPDVKLAQTGIPNNYVSIHQFRMVNTTAIAENYHICRSLLVNAKESSAIYDGDCKDIVVPAFTTSPTYELKSVIQAAINGGDRMIMHVAVSAIQGACKSSDMKESKTYIYAHPPK